MGLARWLSDKTLSEQANDQSLIPGIRGGRREPISECCPLTSTDISQNDHAQTSYLPILGIKIYNSKWMKTQRSLLIICMLIAHKMIILLKYWAI